MSDNESEEPFIEKDISEWQRRKSQSQARRQIVLCLLLAFAILMSPVAYFTGYQKASHLQPKLPTDSITRKGYKPQRQKLDDEFEITDPKNFKYKGLPRPELDKAWEALYKNMNIRVHASEARETNFTSVTLNDNSGDLFGMPTVFHSLHCLKTLRQLQFPESYPETWETYQPPTKGGINSHVDHCIDNLRQAIMCQGDMALYRYEWIPGKAKPHPYASMDHVCANWDAIQDWAAERSFELEDSMFKAPDSV